MQNQNCGEFTCTFHAQLETNSITPVHLSEEYARKYLERLRENPDYRQLMLSTVLACVKNEEKERMIQTLLPERLMHRLVSQDAVTVTFHTDDERGILFHRLVVCRQNGNPADALFGFSMDIPEEAPASRRIGCRGILLEGDNGYLEELLGGRYPLFRGDHPEEIRRVLRENGQEIAAVLTGNGASAEEIRSILACADPEISVVVSVSGNDPAASEYLGLGAYDILHLPCSADELHQKLAHLFALRDATEILHRLETDEVTGLCSREAFLRQADQLLTPEKQFELLCFSIENLPVLVDRYGDAMGNMVLQHVSARIGELVPNMLLSGRLSDEEIVVLREDMPHAPYQELEGRIRDGAPLPNLVVKIGVVHSDGRTSVQTLCMHAETVISAIRQQYGVDIAEYNEALNQKKRREHRILGDMEAALENNQFRIYYQPKHLTATEKIGGAEALIRWNHPEYGPISPSEFIPLFERVGFIRGLDRYVAVQVCRDLKRWQGMGLPVVPVSINLSRRDFETGDLADWLIHLTAQMGIDSSLLHLEITESAFTDDPELIAQSIRKLHRAGFMLELDDFGSGYSSLTMLNNMDIDILKIDRSIVQNDVPDSQRNVLEFCMQLAKMMKLKTVAEGVETPEQLHRLRSLGCDYIQGFYYCAPLPVQEYEQYVRNHQ